MKNATWSAVFLVIFSACGSNPEGDAQSGDSASVATPKTQQSQTPTPADTKKKFDKILNQYQDKIQTAFFSDFTSTTRRGGGGTTERTFDADAFDAFMKKIGFTKLSTGQLDYEGSEDGISILITEKTTSGEHGGWIHNWSIKALTKTNGNEHGAVREFSVDPSAPPANK